MAAAHHDTEPTFRERLETAVEPLRRHAQLPGQGTYNVIADAIVAAALAAQADEPVSKKGK